MRVRIEYGDQNEPFAACLPRDGSVVRVLESQSGDQWHQVSLYRPIDYQLKVHEPFGVRRVVADQVLIRPRHVGERIGGEGSVDVHLYLAEEAQLPISSPLVIDEYVPGCWAVCTRLGGAA